MQTTAIKDLKLFCCCKLRKIYKLSEDFNNTKQSLVLLLSHFVLTPFASCKSCESSALALFAVL